MLSSLPVFVINLPKSTDRKKSLKKQCEKLDVLPIFIEAVNGVELSQDYISKVCDQEKAKELFGRELLLGEIGCALSHKKIYQKMLDEGIEKAIVLEDDVIISNFFSDIIDKINELLIPWELILLGHHKDISKNINSPSSIWGQHSIGLGFKLTHLTNFGFGTYGYIINNKGAKKLLHEISKVTKPIDHYTSDSKVINVYGLKPTLISINHEFETLISESKNRSFKKNKLLVKIIEKTHLFLTIQNIKSFIFSIKPIKRYR